MTYFGIVLAVVAVAVVGVVAVLSLVLVLNNVYSSRSMGLGDFSLPYLHLVDYPSMFQVYLCARDDKVNTREHSQHALPRGTNYSKVNVLLSGLDSRYAMRFLDVQTADP